MSRMISYIKRFGFINFFFVTFTLLNIYNFGYLFGYIAIILIFLKKQFIKNSIEKNLLHILFFSIVYALFYALNPWKGQQFIILYMLTPPVFYLWGKYMVKIDNNENSIFFALIAITILYSVPALISVLLNIYQGGFAQSDRNIPMFWSSDAMNATGMAAFFIFNMCIPALLLVAYRIIPKLLFLFLILIFISSLLCVLRLGSRTQIGIMFLSLVIGLFFSVPKMTLKQNVIVFFILFISVSLIYTKISFDLDSDLFTSFAGRMKDDGAADIASGGGRTKLWKKSIDNLFEKPLGWDLEEFGYSHNLWLDTLRVGGFIPFFILVLYFINFLLLLKRILINKSISIYFQILAVTYSIGFISIFMVEPGIDGSFSLFLLFCFFVGAIRERIIEIY